MQAPPAVLTFAHGASAPFRLLSVTRSPRRRRTCGVGEAQPPSATDDVLPVSVNSPMGEALMKARVGDKIKVRAPRGTMEFKILEIVQ